MTAVPQSPSIINNPMDLGAIERMHMSSNPQKPDTNPNNPRYKNTDKFIDSRGSIGAQGNTFILMHCPTQVELPRWRQCEAIYSH